MQGIQISVERWENDPEISIIGIKGYIDTTTSSELERVIQNLLREQRYKIVVDLSGAEYISSAGWGIFISEIKNLRSHRGDLKLASMSENVNEVYELLEFSTILSAAATVPEAAGLFEGGAAAPLKTNAPAGDQGKTLPVKPAPLSKPSLPAPSRPAATPQMPPSASAPRAERPAMPPTAGTQNKNGAPSAVAFDPSSSAGDSSDTILAPLIDRIQAVVKLHPDWGAWKIKKELNRSRGSQPKVGWGEVRAELKFSGLIGKEARFKFARGR